MIRSLKIITAILIIQLSVVSSSYGQDREVKDCFEKLIEQLLHLIWL